MKNRHSRKTTKNSKTAKHQQILPFGKARPPRGGGLMGLTLAVLSKIDFKA